MTAPDSTRPAAVHPTAARGRAAGGPGDRLALGALAVIALLVAAVPAEARLPIRSAETPAVPLDGIYGTPTFPCPPELQPRVEFWIRIFGEFARHEKVLHDARYPWIIYEVIDVEGLSPEAASRAVDERLEYYRNALTRMALKDPTAFTPPEERLARLLADVTDEARYTRASERLRTQSGVRNAMQHSIGRSGRYMERILHTLEYYGVPEEIAFLPHVESSFQPSVRSHAGALGLWQFTRDTGGRFLTIVNDLDERLDPYASSVAAARFLKDNAGKLGSWPLAVVSYNHGLAGVMRAKNRLGTTEVARVLEEYDGPRFGFASQNFYCEFLAVVEIATDPHRYFDDLVPEDPVRVIDFPLDHFVKLGVLSEAFGIARSELLALNPALGDSYANDSRHLPRGYVLHLPEHVIDPAPLYVSIPESDRSENEPTPRGHQVLSGETLSKIAHRYRVRLADLRAVNGLGSTDHIYPGQVLVLP